jgi:hypothetical protein
MMEIWTQSDISEISFKLDLRLLNMADRLGSARSCHQRSTLVGSSKMNTGHSVYPKTLGWKACPYVWAALVA